MSTNVERLAEIMALLRDPDKGCPWDVEQTFASIAPHTIEEAYEVADAIETGDMKGLEDELGDLLLQVVFHAQMAREQGIFDLEGVAGAICAKLVRRHPHVFGDGEVADARAQLQAWEDHKAGERRARSHHGDGGADMHSVLDGIALGLPALLRALKLQRRAARVGFDWDEADQALAKLDEEMAELKQEMASDAIDAGRLEEEIGDLLFSVVNLARKLELDPELALRRGNAKFDRRFRLIESMLAQSGQRPEDTPLEEMEVLWKRAKGEE